MIDFKKVVSDFCSKNHLEFELCTKMPAGYETANGTFDITKNTLFFNSTMLSQAPDYEALFYLFHELRHVVQYKCPALFDETIQRSLNYVLMYDGTCFKMMNGIWMECKLNGTEQYLTDAYLGQPYEMDANDYAYEQTQNICGSSKELNELYSLWKPQNSLPNAEYMQIYEEIDSKINAAQTQTSVSDELDQNNMNS